MILGHYPHLFLPDFKVMVRIKVMHRITLSEVMHRGPIKVIDKATLIKAIDRAIPIGITIKSERAFL